MSKSDNIAPGDLVVINDAHLWQFTDQCRIRDLVKVDNRACGPSANGRFYDAIGIVLFRCEHFVAVFIDRTYVAMKCDTVKINVR